ncbi:hypothetical protein [Candidatus Frankia alpina]|nr:hypothetical protein [Candidatus Frankia alpina]
MTGKTATGTVTAALAANLSISPWWVTRSMLAARPAPTAAAAAKVK